MNIPENPIHYYRQIFAKIGTHDKITLFLPFSWVKKRDSWQVWHCPMMRNKIIEVGLQDLGKLGHSGGVAKRTLVVMVRGLTTQWKQPLLFIWRWRNRI